MICSEWIYRPLRAQETSSCARFISAKHDNELGKRRIRFIPNSLSCLRADPPALLFHVNDTNLVHFSYERYLENQIRKAYSFLGTPLRLSFRPRSRARA
ncbi:MAG TPA: hypothetical protein VFL17_21205 [Anaerolineae bacterium]|nr:hypothetical protein [Anaerolineae bacterium]